MIGDVPRVGGKGVNTAACIEEHPDDFLACAFPANEGTGTVALRRAADLNPDRVFVDVLPYVCPQTEAATCPAVVGRAMVYRQGSHVTKTYADSMRPLFERALHDVDGPALGRPAHQETVRGGFDSMGPPWSVPCQRGLLTLTMSGWMTGTRRKPYEQSSSG